MPDQEFIKKAQKIFKESRSALMAHTIRGVINYFHSHAIELHIQVIADTVDRIRLKGPNEGATSVLCSKLIKRQNPGKHDRVYATIFIHKNANKHLARFCIAHEIYHLLLEQDKYIRCGRGDWLRVDSTPEVEQACNQFAWGLCKLHDDFNRNDKSRADHIYFPEASLEKPLNSTSSHASHEWPDGIALDPDRPFYANDYSLTFLEIMDSLEIINRWRNQSDPVSAFLWHGLSNEDRLILTNYNPSAPNQSQAQDLVVKGFNRIIAGPCIYQIERFNGVSMRPATSELIKENPTGLKLAHLNRLLLEDAYTLQLWKIDNVEL